jgi:hypothetical protein
VVFKEQIQLGVWESMWKRGGGKDMWWWWRRHGNCWYAGRRKEGEGCREVKANRAETAYRVFKDAHLTFTKRPDSTANHHSRLKDGFTGIKDRPGGRIGAEKGFAQ